MWKKNYPRDIFIGSFNPFKTVRLASLVQRGEAPYMTVDELKERAS
jgi:hypothetical protein